MPTPVEVTLSVVVMSVPFFTLPVPNWLFSSLVGFKPLWLDEDLVPIIIPFDTNLSNSLVDFDGTRSPPLVLAAEEVLLEYWLIAARVPSADAPDFFRRCSTNR